MTLYTLLHVLILCNIRIIHKRIQQHFRSTKPKVWLTSVLYKVVSVFQSSTAMQPSFLPAISKVRSLDWILPCWADLVAFRDFMMPFHESFCKVDWTMYSYRHIQFMVSLSDASFVFTRWTILQGLVLASALRISPFLRATKRISKRKKFIYNQYNIFMNNFNKLYYKETCTVFHQSVVCTNISHFKTMIFQFMDERLIKESRMLYIVSWALFVLICLVVF